MLQHHGVSMSAPCHEAPAASNSASKNVSPALGGPPRQRCQESRRFAIRLRLLQQRMRNERQPLPSTPRHGNTYALKRWRRKLSRGGIFQRLRHATLTFGGGGCPQFHSPPPPTRYNNRKLWCSFWFPFNPQQTLNPKPGTLKRSWFSLSTVSLGKPSNSTTGWLVSIRVMQLSKSLRLEKLFFFFSEAFHGSALLV